MSVVVMCEKKVSRMVYLMLVRTITMMIGKTIGKTIETKEGMIKMQCKRGEKLIARWFLICLLYWRIAH